MKIGIIASIWISNPPKGFGFGAQEYLTYQLAEKLLKKGHDVTLFATGDSQTNAKLISVIPTQLIDDPSATPEMRNEAEIRNVAEAYKHSSEFDIIHNHLLPNALSFAAASTIKTVHTLHHLIYLDKPDFQLYQKYKDQNYVSISNNQRNQVPNLNYVATVYNGIDTGFYKYKEVPDDSYLLYIGRMKKYKGIHTAIKVAKELDIPLKIASPLPSPGQYDYQEVMDYYNEQIKPFENDKIEFINGVEGDNKVRLLQNARAFLFPVERNEPFGMTIIESMACGAPVIAYDQGATTEIVDNNVDGFLCKEYDQLKSSVQTILEMDTQAYTSFRKNARSHVEKSFSIEKMVDGYERVYEKILTSA